MGVGAGPEGEMVLPVRPAGSEVQLDSGRDDRGPTQTVVAKLHIHFTACRAFEDLCQQQRAEAPIPTRSGGGA